MSIVLVFALFISLVFTGLQYRALAKNSQASNQLLAALGLLIFTKFFLGSTTGHLDIYRFIVFLKSWLADPFNNPWTYATAHELSDFPYPPLMMYLHSAVFLPFQGFLNLDYPFAPEALAYTLIKIPLFVADTVWGYWALGKCLQPKVGSIIFVVFNPMVVFHQFYSGQLDWIVIVIFYLSLLGFLDPALKSTRANLAAGIQFALKPFAYLFLPMLVWDRWLENKKQGVLLGVKICIVIILARLTELPFLFTDSYRQQMGRGASKLFARHPFWYDKKNIFIFVLLVLIFVLIPWLRKKCPDRLVRAHLSVVFMVLGFSVFSQHSAGWSLWALPGMFLLHESKVVRFCWYHWLWSLSFILRWAVVSHSPLNDSIAVLFQKFLLWEPEGLPLKMGSIFYWVANSFSLDAAHSIVYATQTAFIVASVLLSTYYIRSISLNDPDDFRLEPN